jgi:ankyrin repeat protein
MVEKDDVQGLEYVLRGAPIDLIINEQGCTLLHLCAFKNQLRCFNQIILSANETLSHVEKDERKKILKTWVNTKTLNDDFSALHYAFFRGNIDICKTLIDLGADKNVKNVHGLGLLHIAA